MLFALCLCLCDSACSWHACIMYFFGRRKCECCCGRTACVL